MRFLADENIPGDAVTELEAAGHDIVWVRTMAPGSKDEDILALAVREERIILTFDKDFGECLAGRTAGIDGHCIIPVTGASTSQSRRYSCCKNQRTY
jgi:predicted nuclease of predicted toxin-antitoxin system